MYLPMVTLERMVQNLQRTLTVTLPPRKRALRPAWQEYGLIPIPAKDRNFFPGRDIPFIICTDIGDIETHCTSANSDVSIGDRKEWKYIAKGITKWYRHHPRLRPGDKVQFTVIEPYRVYRARLVY